MTLKNNNKSQIICFLDTEFNATDYPTQNEGYQEITEIGAVIFREGKIVDRFSRYCKINPEHRISQRSKAITGISQSTLNSKGIPFIDAMLELKEFLEKYDILTIYAFGPADAIELRSTAKLNKASSEIFNLIKKIKNVYPFFQQKLSLKYAFSLIDICRICNIDHEKNGRAHSALSDAEDTGYAFYNAKKNIIDKDILKEINIHKNNVRIYRMNRSIKNFKTHQLEIADDNFIQNIEKIFEESKHKTSPIILSALHDDIMYLIGRPDLIFGEENL